MKKTQSLEVVGYGTINLYPIKVKKEGFQLCSSELKPLKKVLVSKGTQAVYKYIDETGKEYEKKETGYNIKEQFLQKVNRSKKILKSEIIDKSEIIGNFMADKYYIIDADTTTQMNLDKLGDNKALQFQMKLSSIGFNWSNCYLYKLGNCFVLAVGYGFIEQGINQFNIQKTAVKQIQDLNEVVIKATADADEIEVNI